MSDQETTRQMDDQEADQGADVVVNADEANVETGGQDAEQPGQGGPSEDDGA